MTFEESARAMTEAARIIREDFTKRFQAAVSANDPIAYSRELGFGKKPEDIEPCGYDPRAPIKFVYDPVGHLRKVGTYLPFFAAARSCYEIGVGVGYLLRALIDVHGIKASGCDVGLKTLGVYREMRKLLGVSHLVEEQRIVSGRPIALPAGTEIVTAFMSTFDHDWAIADYQWFFSEMKRHGVSKVLWLPNRNESETRDYFSSIGGTFPVKSNENRFVVIRL